MSDHNDKPMDRLTQFEDNNSQSSPVIEAAVVLKKPNLEMHLEPAPTTGAPEVCTGNPMCYCVGVGACSCDKVCSCDNVCTKDPACSCVDYKCPCVNYHCSCDSQCRCQSDCKVCSRYCVCEWVSPPCTCNIICSGY